MANKEELSDMEGYISSYAKMLSLKKVIGKHDDKGVAVPEEIPQKYTLKQSFRMSSFNSFITFMKVFNEEIEKGSFTAVFTYDEEAANVVFDIFRN